MSAIIMTQPLRGGGRSVLVGYKQPWELTARQRGSVRRSLEVLSARIRPELIKTQAEIEAMLRRTQKG